MSKRSKPSSKTGRTSKKREKVTPSSGNVFADLGLPNAKKLLARAKTGGKSSSISTSSLWFVQAEVRAMTVQQYISLNEESTALTPEVLDAIGFILFSYHNKRRARIIAAEYVGVCLH